MVDDVVDVETDDDDVVDIDLVELEDVRRQIFELPTALHLKTPFDVVRICPVFLQVAPAIETDFIEERVE